MNRRQTAYVCLMFALGMAAGAHAQLPEHRCFEIGGGYVENRGQWDARAAFQLRDGDMSLWVTRDGFLYDLHRVQRAASARDRGGHAAQLEPGGIARHVVQISFDGASSGASVHGEAPMTTYRNYLLSSDRSHWASRVPVFGAARLQHLYDGIDAYFYLDAGQPRYDLILAPGADPAGVHMRIEGADAIAVADDGRLAITTSLGTIEQQGLVAYQNVEGQRRIVQCRFVEREKGVISFEVGSYDRARQLVIDPLLFSVTISGSNADDALGMALAPNGDIYFAGYSFSDDFPTTTGAYDSTYGSRGGPNQLQDGFVAALSSDGSALRFATYLGGKAEDVVNHLVIDSAGNVAVTGYTYSKDFPTIFQMLATQTITGDMFISGLSPDGTRLVYSAVLGGTDLDNGNGIAVDRDGNICVVASTYSYDFPFTGTTLDGKPFGRGITLMKLPPHADSIIFARCIGSSEYSQAEDLVLEPNGDLAIIGSAYAADYPVTPDALHATFDAAKPLNAVVTVVSSAGDSIRYSTFLGPTSESERTGTAIAVSPDGAIVAAGWTESSAFKTTTGTVGTSLHGAADIFIAKLVRGAPEQCVVTLVGGSDMDIPVALDVDDAGTVYVGGGTYGGDFPTTPLCLDNTFGGDGQIPDDGFLLVLSPKLDSIRYSTFIGGSESDFVHCLKVDRAHHVYLGGITGSADFPVSRPHIGPAPTDRAFILELMAQPEPSGVDEDRAAAQSAGCFAHVECAPMPARTSLVVEYDLAAAGVVSMTLVAPDGREVLRPVTAHTEEAGHHRVAVDVAALPSGSYWLRLQSHAGAVAVPVVVAH